MKVPFSYLDRQFEQIDSYLKEVKEFVKTGDFTLGKPLVEFEKKFAALCKASYALGVNSGTDAIAIALKMLGVKPGDEVITTPMTFIATVGAIVMTGAIPVFVDSEDGFVIDPDQIEAKITSKTKAIVPVHYTGNLADMPKIRKIADKYKLKVVEDSCQSIAGEIDGKPIGSWGDAAAFSFHPLKNLNVWSDAGMIVTNSASLAEKVALYRNHGLINRDEVAIFGCNSRFDTIQAVIGNRLIKEVDFITNKRIQNAAKYDEAFKDLEEFVSVPKRRKGVKHVYHLYIIRVKERDKLLRYLNDNGVEAKVHYPIPVHLQKAAEHLGYKKGSFPKCEKDCECIITLPAHQHITDDEIDYTIQKMKEFYIGKKSPKQALAASGKK